MSNISTTTSAAAAPAGQDHARPTLRAMRCACQNCHTHTFLVLRTIGDAKCIVCNSHDLIPVDEQSTE